jgi:hypothetical protein
MREGGILEMCKKLEISPSLFMRRRKQDDRIKEAVVRAKELKVMRAEAELWDRAMHGVEVPVYDKTGDFICTKRDKKDPVPLFFFLKAELPDKYRENSKFNFNVGAGGPVRSMADLPEAEVLKMIEDAATAPKEQDVSADVKALPESDETEQ